MGLLDRFRSGRQADGDHTSPDRAATPAGPEHSPEPVEPRQVITARDLWSDVPEWQKVPPIEPVIEEPPWIVSQHFDDSLVARQAPPQFVGELGHSVSETAPSGVVEAVAVLAPELDHQPPTEAGHPDPDELPLAAPHAIATEKSGPRIIQERHLWPEQRGPFSDAGVGSEPDASAPPPSPELWTEPDATAHPAPGEPVPAEPAPRPADLVGAAPGPPTVQRLAVAEIEPSPLVRAETPADMPLVQLPSSPLPPSPAQLPVAPNPPASEPAPTAALVGSRPPATPPVPQPVVAREPDVATPEAIPDLPLAPAPSEPARASAADFHDDVPDQPIQQIGESQPLGVESSSDTSGAPEPVDLVLPPTAPPAEEVAPLVGQSTPIAAEPEPLAPVEAEDFDRSTPAEAPLPIAQRAADPSPPPAHSEPPSPPIAARPTASPPASRRVGLGAPLADVPPTSVGWDITKLSRSDQTKWSREMARVQRSAIAPDIPAALSGMPLAGERPARALGQPTRTEPLVAGGPPLPVVPLEEYAPPVSESAVTDLPPPGDREAPILALAPPLRPADSPGPPSAGPQIAAPAPVVQRAASTSSEGSSTRAAVGRLHGVDLSNVPVHRSEEASAAATDMHARAFTSPSGIAIPPSVGPLDSGEGRALLAHELTHVAQRARLGGQVPDERSPAGQVLEAEARATELVYASPVAVPTKPSQSAEGVDDESASLPLAPQNSGPDQEALAASILQRISDLSGTPAGSEFPMVMTSPLVSGGDLSQIQRADPSPPTAAATTTTPTASTTTPSAKKADKDTGPFGKRPSDKELANLSYWLYPLISHKIKGELREGRERLGMITDHYRRW